MRTFLLPHVTALSLLFSSTVALADMQNAGSACELLPLQQQLATPEVRRELPQYAEINYRNQLLRFISYNYSRIADDVLRGDGEYLVSLHRLMGSDSAVCTQHYRDLLLTHNNSLDFGKALWLLRSSHPTTAESHADSATTHATAEAGIVSPVE